MVRWESCFAAQILVERIITNQIFCLRLSPQFSNIAVTMDSTTLYGYVPTGWFNICFAAACLSPVFTTIPCLFKNKYRNIGLGFLLLFGVIFQVTGHVSVTISAYKPTSIPAWIVQFLAFGMGRAFSRLAACNVYGKMVNKLARRIAVKAQLKDGEEKEPCTGRWLAVVPVYSSIWAIWLWADRIVKVVHPGHPDIIKDGQSGAVLIIGVFPIVATAILISFLIATIWTTRKTLPWFRLTWRSGYFVTLMITPAFLLAQDIFILIKQINKDYHNEMMDLVFDMGITKVVLMLLGCQTYEMANAWNENPPKGLLELVAFWQNLTSHSSRNLPILTAKEEEIDLDNVNTTQRTSDKQV